MALAEERIITFADLEIVLPKGVTTADWALEQMVWQNPRIRAFLGCIRVLDGVMESNYAILHCSPERLLEIWKKVLQVSELIRNRLQPLLQSPSKMVPLERARENAIVALDLLSRSVLDDLDRFPEDIKPERVLELRKTLCISIGKLHAFLQDTFGELMSADPRSHHDADYYISKRFPRDIEEAEWLYKSIEQLDRYLQKTTQPRRESLSPLINKLRQDRSVPIGRSWEDARGFLDTLADALTPKLREVLAMRGVRFYEMEILDRYMNSIPTRCQVVIALQKAGRKAVEAAKTTPRHSLIEREQAVRDLKTFHRAIASEMSLYLDELDRTMQDLVTFTPLWLDSLRKRRALLSALTDDEE